MLISREQFMALTARINERYLPWLNVVQGDLTCLVSRVCLSSGVGWHLFCTAERYA